MRGREGKERQRHAIKEIERETQGRTIERKRERERERRESKTGRRCGPPREIIYCSPADSMFGPERLPPCRIDCLV